MGFSRQEYWSRLPFPFPGDLPDPGIEPRSPTLQADSLWSEPPGKNPKKTEILPFETPWMVALQARPSKESSRQEYWSGLPFPSPGDLPNPGIEPRSPTLQADALTSEPPGKPELTYFSLILRTAQMCPRVFRFVFVSFDEPRYCLK